MKKSRYIITSVIFSTILILTGCGGGGGGDGASPSAGSGTATALTDPDQQFSLAGLQSTTLGTVYTTQLTGSDTNGVTYSGAFSIANRAQTMLNGVLVTPHDLILSLTGGEISITVTGTSNVDTSGNLISIFIQTTGLTCTPVSPDSMPTSVKIGEFGIQSTLTCSDNTIQENNWRVEDAGDGNINIITSGTVKDQFNAVISIADVTFTLDGDGNIVAFKTVVTIMASNYTLSYESI